MSSPFFQYIMCTPFIRHRFSTERYHVSIAIRVVTYPLKALLLALCLAAVLVFVLAPFVVAFWIVPLLPRLRLLYCAALIVIALWLVFKGVSFLSEWKSNLAPVCE